jgi:hypothetical protein
MSLLEVQQHIQCVEGRDPIQTGKEGPFFCYLCDLDIGSVLVLLLTWNATVQSDCGHRLFDKQRIHLSGRQLGVK